MAFFERCSVKRCTAVYAPCQSTADQFGRDTHRKVYVLETPFQNDVQCYDYSFANQLKGKNMFSFLEFYRQKKGLESLQKYYISF